MRDSFIGSEPSSQWLLKRERKEEQQETNLTSLNKSSQKASLRQGRTNSQMTQQIQTNSRKPSTAREQKIQQENNDSEKAHRKGITSITMAREYRGQIEKAKGTKSNNSHKTA